MAADRLGAELNARTSDTGLAEGNVAVVADPVCGMKVRVLPDAPHVTFQRKEFYFCSDMCREEFSKVRTTTRPSRWPGWRGRRIAEVRASVICDGVVPRVVRGRRDAEIARPRAAAMSMASCRSGAGASEYDVRGFAATTDVKSRCLRGSTLPVPTPLTPRAVEQMVLGLSTRTYERSLEPTPVGIPSRGSTFGRRALVQRCQIHNRRNVEDHLPESMKKQVAPTRTLIV